MKKNYIFILPILAVVIAFGVFLFYRLQSVGTLDADKDLNTSNSKEMVKSGDKDYMQEELEQTENINSTTEEPVASYKNEITLAIKTPKNGDIVTSSSLSVTGTTSPNAEVFVNDKETKADSDGDFSVKLILEEDENYILITANDSEGNSAEQDLSVIYQPKE